MINTAWLIRLAPHLLTGLRAWMTARATDKAKAQAIIDTAYDEECKAFTHEANVDFVDHADGGLIDAK